LYFIGKSMSLKEEIFKLINLAAEDSGYDIYEASLFLKGDKTRIIVRIDRIKDNTPISHRDCEIYSQSLSRLLDEKDLLPGYFLEISSPGINRKVRDKGEFLRFRGCPVKIVYEYDGRQLTCKGLIGLVEDDCVEIELGSDKVKINYNSIINANLDY
ncbi:MAG TPA: hypothetical protein PK104_13460, partial [Spirochaetota bacterium]|nr:hypothetical protein [Spirochaetota bacterium]